MGCRGWRQRLGPRQPCCGWEQRQPRRPGSLRRSLTSRQGCPPGSCGVSEVSLPTPATRPLPAGPGPLQSSFSGTTLWLAAPLSLLRLRPLMGLSHQHLNTLASFMLKKKKICFLTPHLFFLNCSSFTQQISCRPSMFISASSPGQQLPCPGTLCAPLSSGQPLPRLPRCLPASRDARILWLWPLPPFSGSGVWSPSPTDSLGPLLLPPVHF